MQNIQKVTSKAKFPKMDGAKMLKGSVDHFGS